MPRKSRSDLLGTLKVRHRMPGKTFRTRFVLSGNHKKPRSKGGGRILRGGKVSYEELFKVGEFNPLPDMLMKEFNSDREVNKDGQGS